MPLTFEGVFTPSGEGRRGSRRGEGFRVTFAARREEPFAITGLSAVTRGGGGDGDTTPRQCFGLSPLRPPGEDASLGFKAGEGSGGRGRGLRAGRGGEGAGGRRAPELPPERAALAPVTRSKINMSVRGCHLRERCFGQRINFAVTDRRARLH